MHNVFQFQVNVIILSFVSENIGSVHSKIENEDDIPFVHSFV